MDAVLPFALFGSKPLFGEPKPTGNLYRPDIEAFLEYSRFFYRKGSTDESDLCRSLESRLAQFHDVKHVILVNSGFWGHVIAMSALALPGRTEIIAPAFAYRRTGDMIAWSGYIPHFCDVDAHTLGPSIDSIKAALNENTALILAPHPMVSCCDAGLIEELGRARGIPVVFDSVEAAYRVYKNRRIGGFGNAEVFSMHATKLLNSFEGGYITTNNSDLACRLGHMKRVDRAALQGAEMSKALEARLTEMHAAMALASLDAVTEQVALHRRRYRRYKNGLGDIDGLTLLEHDESERPDYRLIVVRIGASWPLSREDTLRVLQAENALARPYYFPLNRITVKYVRICPSLSITDSIFGNFMVLPSGSHVSEEDIDTIVEILVRVRRHADEIRLRLKAQ